MRRNTIILLGIMLPFLVLLGCATVKTDEEGVYRKDDLEPGKYTVNVDAPGYEDIEEEVEIKSSKAS